MPISSRALTSAGKAVPEHYPVNYFIHSAGKSGNKQRERIADHFPEQPE
jgi:hypothetical protein